MGAGLGPCPCALSVEQQRLLQAVERAEAAADRAEAFAAALEASAAAARGHQATSISILTSKSTPKSKAKGKSGSAFEPVASGALRLLSANWLLEQPQGYVLQRCQDLPEEAFLPPRRAMRLLRSEWGVVVVSYGWLTKGHPDPLGFHLETARRYLRLHVTDTDKDEFKGSQYGDVGVFWDFASLPQADAQGHRTEKEKAAFKAGLGSVNFLYGANNTTVIQLTRMPEEAFVPPDGSPVNPMPYDQRGWCYFEATSSSICKPPGGLLDLGLAAAALAAEDASLEKVSRAAEGQRPPPLAPATMRAALMGGKYHFTSGADRELVAGKYEEFFHEVAATVEHFCMMPQWSSEEVVQFAAALPFFTGMSNCEHYWNGGGAVADEAAILAVLAALPSNLLCLDLHKCSQATEACVDAFARRLPELPGMWHANCPKSLSKTAAAKRLRLAWLDQGKEADDLDWM